MSDHRVDLLMGAVAELAADRIANAETPVLEDRVGQLELRVALLTHALAEIVLDRGEFPRDEADTGPDADAGPDDEPGDSRAALQELTTEAEVPGD